MTPSPKNAKIYRKVSCSDTKMTKLDISQAKSNIQMLLNLAIQGEEIVKLFAI